MSCPSALPAIEKAATLHGEEGTAEEDPYLEQHILEHGTTILVERARPHPDTGRIRHGETEIRAFRDGINRARKLIDSLVCD
jgi:hypothetical protein